MLPKLNFLWQYVDYWAEQDPNYPSIKISEMRNITAHELQTLTFKAAEGLIDRGIKKGDTIVTILPTIPEFLIIFLAATRIGAIIVPMDVGYKRADFLNLIPHSQPKLIITAKSFHKNKIANTLMEIKAELGNIPVIVKSIHEIGPEWDDFMALEFHHREEVLVRQKNQTDEDDILVVWTGGSTGLPKAVTISHKNFIVMARLELEIFYKGLHLQLGQNRIKMLVNLPVSHVGGVIELMGTCLIGGNCAVMQKEWSPWPSLQAMHTEDIQFLGGVPTMFSIWLSLPDLDTYHSKDHLKLAIMSGDKVSLDLLTKIRDRICPNILIGYGSTEAGSEVTFTSVGDKLEDLAKGYVGHHLSGVDIKIVDEKGNRLGPNMEGEILVKGDITSKRYFNQPEETKRGFTPDGYCRTGDLGHLDEKGGLWITGRIKFIIRVGSYTVLPQEIEDVANKQKNVMISAAFGIPDEKYGEVVWLVIGPEPGTTVDENAIRTVLQSELASYKVPRKILIYRINPEDLPITRIGKVDRPRLQRELNLPTR